MLRRPEELRDLLDAYLEELPPAPELGPLAEPVRYALAGGGKRVRPLLCLATAEAAGASAEEALPAAAALELVHTFSLVHDDLPALDDDAVRRGRPSVHVRFGEASAILAGDALLGEAFRLALSYRRAVVARELADAVVAMIGGQYLDVTGRRDDETRLNRLKTGALFDAAIGCGLSVAGVGEDARGPWRALAAQVGLLFQVVDDLLDGDGCVATLGGDRTRALADETAARAEAALDAIPADTSILAEIVAGLATRTA